MAALVKTVSSLVPRAVAEDTSAAVPASSSTVSVAPRRDAAAAAAAASSTTVVAGGVSRRDALVAGSAALACTLFPAFSPMPDVALAIGAPKGFTAREDSIDRYRFFYPFGWQEVSVRGQDVVFKDVIEPLESVSVNIIPTEKSDVRELGLPENVAKVLVEKVLTGPTQTATLNGAVEKEVDGRHYYVFEFQSAAPSYKRHALGVIAIGNGKFYTLTTGANERRWSAVEEKLRAVVNSFEII